MAAAAFGWAVLATVAWLTLRYLGWLGLAAIGVIIALIATRAELGEDAPGLPIPGAADRSPRMTPEDRLTRHAGRSDFERWCAAARAVGIALAVTGAVMFVRHQL